MCRSAANLILAITLLISGCRGTSGPQAVVKSPSVHPELSAAREKIDARAGTRPGEATIHPVAYQEPLPEPVPAPVQSEVDVSQELGLQEFVAEVVARHPSVEALLAAWQAAAQRY